MTKALKVLHDKLGSSPDKVGSKEVSNAQTEFNAMPPADLKANRELLLSLRYRVNTSKVAVNVKRELEKFQGRLPERDWAEAAQHIGTDLGGNAMEVGGEMANGVAGGVQEIAGKAMKGDIVGAVTHPLAATVLGITGMTYLSNWVLGTKNSVLSNIFLFTGAKFVSEMIKKYSA